MRLYDRFLRIHTRGRPSTQSDAPVGIEGFLPPEEAAKVMGVSVPELARLVQRGHLEAADVGRSELWVRPAVVSVLEVTEVR